MLGKPYDWASAQMPINIMDAHYRSFQKEVVPVCLEKNVGVIGMKSLAGGSPGRIPSQTDITAEECIRFSLSLPVSTLVVGLESMKREATAIFSRTAEAYETLKDDQKRANYDDVLDSGSPEIDTTSLAQAETFFRKGEILVKMGDFRGALQFLQNAVDLWPEEAAYQATLGWALYKKNPPDPERAKEHLELALPLAPKDAVVHYRLGLVLKALGEREAGEDSINRAKKLDPNVVDTR